jgi:ADP-dependent NAD(P)H-hydrate dehydratase / NAD(P)H-hydrate epimerase
MKIFSSKQVREIDSYTIAHEPISSTDLMERAAGQLYKWISERYGISEHFFVFAGPGNNGGDGLALARMLAVNGYNVDVYCIVISEKKTNDFELNLKRLENVTNVSINYITDSKHLPVILPDTIIIDAIFGTGLTRQPDGLAREVIRLINRSDSAVISVDIPSGLFAEDNSINTLDTIIESDFTLSFHFPKLAFMFPDTGRYAGEWFVLPIGLHSSAVINSYTPYNLTVNRDVVPLLADRKKFDHKGNFGHGLLIAGSAGKMGAAVLGAKAALRTGIGLVSCHIPSCGNLILQTSVPEAMVISDKSENHVSESGNTDSFNAIGVGPGMGTSPESQRAVAVLLKTCRKPLVIDADGLNILSLNKELLNLLPPGTILTPHQKEFERLSGIALNCYDRLMKQIEFSKIHNCIVILKGAHTSISTPDGEIFFNSTGNPGMATGGSGDVLTGILLSLIAQGYQPVNAAILGVYLHGLAGDIAASESCYESIIATDIINCIGKAFNKIRCNGITS